LALANLKSTKHVVLELTTGDPEHLSSNMTENSANVSIHAVAIKLPTFYQHNPDGWFINAEAQFALGKITDERTKFYHAVRVLDINTSAEIQQFLVEQCTNDTNPYSQLKNKLIRVFGKRKTTRMAELLATQSFNENGAESTLRRMQTLATDMDTMLQCKLLSMAPAAARTAVASREYNTAEELASALDEAMEKERLSTGPTIQASSSAVAECTANSAEEENFLASVRTAYRNSTHPSPVHAERRRRTTADNGQKPYQPDGGGNNICFYHNKFGAKARKCTGKPCKFSDLVQPLNSKASN
jgi:hypothetical protein